MPQRNVHLTEHFDQFIDVTVESGRFSNASEMVREGLRLLEQREREDAAKVEWLRSAVKEGFDAIERGEYTTLNSDAELRTFMRGIQQEVAAELDGGRA